MRSQAWNTLVNGFTDRSQGWISLDNLAFIQCRQAGRALSQFPFGPKPRSRGRSTFALFPYPISGRRFSTISPRLRIAP
jgi:hypothetical protein